MRLRLVATLAALALVLTLTGPASAALVELGTGTIDGGDGTQYKLIYDDLQDITWLDRTHSPATWYDQSAWAEALTVVFNSRPLGTWRLPEAQPLLGLESGSELDLLSRELRDNHSGLTSGPFDHLLQDWYWSGTSSAGDPAAAWTTYLSDGFQYVYGKDNALCALAVMAGNPVPLPSALWLVASGLPGLAGLGRRIRK